MKLSQFDVLVVGAGTAGITAAIGLARAGFAVAVVEAASYPGAENWSGCVYFAENLADPDILGPDGVEALAWERRLVERGFFATDGHGILGATYRDPDAFRHCYTVLRPIFDHHLGQIALRHGVALLNATTAESLIRDGSRIIGVATNRGPLYADLVFLAEGDASHLVTREGYERSTDPRDAPEFLHGIKQVIELPPGAVEERFGVGAEDGVAYEMLLRNGTLSGRPLHLNMGGFVYTNRQSLSVGLVLPAANLAKHFSGDPNLLIEWFCGLPALRPWLRDGKRGLFGVKLIRGGGAKDIPTLIDDGLAIGGAASAIGVDFPYPNFTGPATAMGLLLVRAVKAIRAGGEDFTRAALERHYLGPLQQTHYWKDVEFLRRWPEYVKRTRFFFGRSLDLALGSAYVWTRPRRWLFGKMRHWLRLLNDEMTLWRWAGLRADGQRLGGALRMQETIGRPALGRLLLDGTLNALRDLVGRPRAHVPPAGELRLHFRTGDDAAVEPPKWLRRWFGRFRAILAAAARTVYRNDDTPLAVKLPEALHLLARQINLLDVLAVSGFCLSATVAHLAAVGWSALRRRFGREVQPRRGLAQDYAEAARQASDLTPVTERASKTWDDRLAHLSYEGGKKSHIHILWPLSLVERDAVTEAALWHVCPARVYEAHVGAQGQVQVVVNFDNCIKCETCWRTSDFVDWGRDGEQRFVYPVRSPVVARVLDTADAAGLVVPVAPRQQDVWAQFPTIQGVPLEVGRVLKALESSLARFDDSLADGPRTVGRDRAEQLEALARHAQQLARRLAEVLTAAAARTEANWQVVRRLAEALAVNAEERAKKTWDRRFAWAAGGGRQIRQHHLAGLRRLLGPLPVAADPCTRWLAAEAALDEAAKNDGDGTVWLDTLFPAGMWRDLERGLALTPEQDALLLALANSVPQGNDPKRAVVLAALGRRDPSLAHRVACHLWARDLAALFSIPSPEQAGEWRAFAILEGERAVFVPAAQAKSLLLLAGDQLALVSAADVHVEPQGTLGLRGAGMARIHLETVPAAAPVVDRAEVMRTCDILSSADLMAIALGMADVLCRRATEYATSRVQFPGLFQDEEARDAVGKFGAVKRLIAAVAARRYLLETLTFDLSRNVNTPHPQPLTPKRREWGEDRRAALTKALAAECLCAIAYDAGQVFGGMGYSEDDVLAKLYRDAAAWRFLGVPNVDVWQAHGLALLQNWRPDGSALSQPDDGGLFVELQQRQALQTEYDEVRRLRVRLITVVNDWKRDGQETADVAEVAEELARQDAHLYAAAALLRRTHARLERGLDVEAEIPLLRVWLEETSVAQGRFAEVVRTALDPADRTYERPLVEPDSPPAVTSYAAFLATTASYDSGDYLCGPIDLNAPRAVPELVQADAELAAADDHYAALLAGYFSRPRAGLGYERFLEKHHRPSAEDLRFCREQGLFRILLPTEVGGEGRSRLEFYLLLLNLIRKTDVGLALVIQVHSSVGINPILHARDKNLPAALQKPGSVSADELKRRLEACDLALKSIVSGQIAAFALTEATAGSDTARIATRAVLRSVPVEREADGVLRFIPHDGREPRHLLDSGRLDFSTGTPAYRWSDHQLPAPIHSEDADTIGRVLPRSYDHGGRRITFTDIAQVRERDGGLWYDYWELDGSKMWITNGDIAGVFSLYARTALGLTGFLVDRHAEGLVVGKDEEKLGQKGSPTNELSLHAVRVPRENVLGVEGRGQVNALEALNAGRAGMAMSSLAQIRRIIEEVRAFVDSRRAGGVSPLLIDLNRGLTPPARHVEWRLRHMEEDEFLCAALAFDVVGRAEHRGTKSARLESAVAKMLATELVQRVVERAEEIYGLAGQTTDHLIEKRKRDARVLTIYEGTSEIQRFLILRDLVNEVAPRWTESPPRHLARDVLELEALKAAFRQRFNAAKSLFGQSLWQNPNLQANVFALPEAAAWLKAADSVLGRMAWLCRHDRRDDEPAARHPVGARALARALTEVKDRLRRFDDDLAELRRGHYAPHVRAASVLFDRLTCVSRGERETQTVIRDNGHVSSVLVIVEPFAADVPEPHVADGRLLEAHWTLNTADRAALETALRLRDMAPERVTVDVVAVGPARIGQILREALCLGVSRVRLVESDSEVTAADAVAAALVYVLNGSTFDAIVWGDDGAHAEGAVGTLVAEALGVPLRLPVVDGVSLRPYTTVEYLQSSNRRVESVPWPAAVPVRRATVTACGNLVSAPAETAPPPLAPAEAAQALRELLGVGATNEGSTSFSSVIEELSAPRRLGGEIVAIVAADSNGRLSATTGAVVTTALALRSGAAVSVLLLAPPEESVRRAALARLLEWCGVGVSGITLIVQGRLDEVRPALLRPFLAGATMVVGEPWTARHFAALARWQDGSDRLAVRVRQVGLEDDAWFAETTRMGGKLVVRESLSPTPGGALWISLSSEAESGAPPKLAKEPIRIGCWAPPATAPDMANVLAEVRRAAGVVRLADAEFILDVGFGVGGRDGYDEVIVPLEQALRDLGVRGLIVGGSRKATEELHLLPSDRQIGQSGVGVNPRVLIAIGVSGAPQHLNYIGPRAVIVAFNRDPEAPLMTLNRRQPRPRVLPVVGDLFETVPALTAALRKSS